MHGLNGDAFKTWTTKKTQISWLDNQEMLPKVIKNARILTWGYNADVTVLMGRTSSQRIMQHAHTLVAELEADRAVIKLRFLE